MQKSLRAVAVAACLTALTTGPPALAADTPDAPPQHQAASSHVQAAHPKADQVTKELLRLVNQARAKEKAQPLTEVPKLNQIGQRWSDHLSDTGTFEHNPNLAKEIMGTGATGAGENIAMGPNNDSPEKVAKALFDQWMNSPGHRANILNSSYNGMGLGTSVNDDGQYVAAQEFAVYSTIPK